MNGRGRAGSGARLAMVTILSVSIFLLGTGVISSGCGGSGEQASADKYKKQWTETVDAFQARVIADDKKATAMIEKNDIAGVIELMNQRIANFDEVTGKILDLRPPKDLRKLHAITLFYLVSISDQMKANSDLYEALRTGKPTTDLQTIAEGDAKQTEAVKLMLGLEMDKNSIKLKEIKQNESPQSSASATIPK